MPSLFVLDVPATTNRPVADPSVPVDPVAIDVTFDEADPLNADTTSNVDG